MSNMNGIVAMMNSLQHSLNTCTNSLYELTSRIASIEAQITSPLHQATAPPQQDHSIREDLTALKNKLMQVHVELDAFKTQTKDSIAKERTLVEATVIAKAEELVKRVVRERVQNEMKDLMDNVKAYVDDQITASHAANMATIESREFDAVSIALSESTGGKRGRRALKKINTIDVPEPDVKTE